MATDIYLIDGHAQIYRAYYALMNLKSASGEPTNATFGFMSALLKLMIGRRPSHLAVALDAGSSHREQVDPQYKATRRPMPDDMPVQIKRISEMLVAAGIATLRVPGYEADDVVATFVRRVLADPAHRESRIFICSRDKDLEALISDRVFLYDIERGEIADAAALMAKKGYPPEHVRDILTLTGDQADNIPGIPGVGPKTAAKWIGQYGSLDELLKHVSELGGKVGESLRENRHLLDISRQLVRLQDDVPLDVTIDTTAVNTARLTALTPFFVELNFKSLIPQFNKTLEGYGQTQPPDGIPGDVSPPVEKTARKASVQPQLGAMPGGLFSNLQAALPEATGGAEQPDEDTSATQSQPLSPAIGQMVVGQPVIGQYVLVNTPESLSQMMYDIGHGLANSSNRWLAIDTETDSLSAVTSGLCGISLCVNSGRAWYIAVKGVGLVLENRVVCEVLAPLLADATIVKIGQNLKYDINVLRRHGYRVEGDFFDTMVASYLIDSARRSHSMDALAADLLGLAPIPIKDLIGSGSGQRSFADVPVNRACQYAAEDADVTFRLAEVLEPRITQMHLSDLLNHLEMPMVRVLAEMELTGICVDRDILKTLDVEMTAQIGRLGDEIISLSGAPFNIDSPRQLADVLFVKLGLPIQRKTRTGPSTDIAVLEALRGLHPLPELVIEYRQLSKLRNTYTTALLADVVPETGRVHTSFNQTVAETGRLSSSDPNLQNIPVRTQSGREIRRAFVAPGADWCLISADYSQIELRVLAHFCREPALLEAFSKDVDIHQFVAMEIYGRPAAEITADMRRVAKTVNFGIVYGQTPFGLANTLKISRDEAAQFIDKYRARFPGISHFTTQ